MADDSAFALYLRRGEAESLVVDVRPETTIVELKTMVEVRLRARSCL